MSTVGGPHFVRPGSGERTSGDHLAAATRVEPCTLPDAALSPSDRGVIARRLGAAATIAVMLADVSPAIAIPIAHHAWLDLFGPDLGAAITFSLVGAFLLVRGAVTNIAVMLCVQGTTASLTVLTGVLRSLESTHGPLHGIGIWSAWLNGLVWLPGVLLLVPVVLLFPDGTLASPRWRWPILVNLSLAAAFAIIFVVRRGSLVDTEKESFAPNPTGFVRFGSSAQAVVNVFSTVIVLSFASMLLISLGSLVVRRRKAEGVQRAQLTSLLFGGSLTVLLLFVLAVLPQPNVVTFAIGLVSVAPLAASIGVAVLRYRLYEIDRIVSRTVTYLLVLAVLVAVYVAVVGGLVAIVGSDFGQLGVAAATLAVSLLAVPLTRRVRRWVERRFNRRRFDADQLVARYAEQLRRDGGGDTVDSIGAGLLAVATRVVEPRHASVWLLPSQGSRRTERSSAPA